MHKTTEPAAWLVDGGEYQYVTLFRESADAAADTEGGTVTPLYHAPALTDAEREAVEAVLDDPDLVLGDAREPLRGLLERMTL